MPTPIVMPSFGMFTAEGTLARWLVADGERVRRDEVILEIETEKSLNDVVAPADGVLRHSAAVGAHVREQGVLGYILAEGEALPRAGAIGSAETPAPVEAVAREVRRERTSSGHVRASPIARKIAAEHGIDLSRLEGSGPGGRIVERDVVALIGAQADVPGPPNPDTAAGQIRGSADAVLPPGRREIAARLRRSAETTVPVTLIREVEAEHLVAAREAAARRYGGVVPFDAFFVRLLAATVRERLSAGSGTQGDAPLASRDVSIGFAVSVANRLFVPVVRDACTSPFAHVVEEIRRLAGRARSLALRAEDCEGAASTVTNLGRYGVDAFTPVLNPPQATILGVGRILQRPAVRGGTVTAARTCVLSLTFDHLRIDGAPAAELLDGIARRMNDIAFLRDLSGA